MMLRLFAEVTTVLFTLREFNFFVTFTEIFCLFIINKAYLFVINKNKIK